MTRALVVLLLACGCAPAPPDSFGVNVTITATGLPADVRGRIASARLRVTGDQPFDHALDIAAPLKQGEARFRYVPTIAHGTLRLLVDVAAANGGEIAHGDSGNVTLAARAVAVKIALQPGATVAVPDMAITADLAPSPDLLQLKQPGDRCARSSECGSEGGCVDGVCCDIACSGPCVACNQPGSVGKCTPRALGTACGASSCDATTNRVTPTPACDGDGKCVTPATMPCDPYLCDGTQNRCFSSCTQTTGQCSGSNVCSNMSCGPKNDGAMCKSGSECLHANCVDGVCCDSACAGACNTCNQPDALGKCTVVRKAGADPRGMCPAASGADAACTPGGCDGSANKCLQLTVGAACGGSCTSGVPVTATCDAAGRCTGQTVGTSCSVCTICGVVGKSAACVAAPTTKQCMGAACDSAHSTYTPAAFCDGSGSCAAATQTKCYPYSCTTSGCNTKCMAQNDCDPSAWCEVEVLVGSPSYNCYPKGATNSQCEWDYQCLSGMCVMNRCN